MNELRDYQVEACDAVIRELETVRATLLVMPTGTGKTRVFSEILRRRQEHGRSLVLAHRDELIAQAAHAITRDSGLATEIEQASERASVRSLLGVSPVVVASVQSLHKRRRERWPGDHFATVIVDEAHHATAASYVAILEHFAASKVIGVTATPDRADKIGLRHVFDSVAYEMEIRDAISKGWLCPILAKTVQCADLDLRNVRTAMGDLSEKDLQQAFGIDAVHHQIAAPLADLAGDRKTILFVSGVETAKVFASVFAGYKGEGSIECVHAKTPADERRAILERFKAGGLQFVVNVGVLTEGFDAPSTSCIAIARPTKSRALYAQMIGRGTRMAAGKENLLVLDFAGQAGRHKLVSSIDVLAGKDLPDAQAAVVRKAVADGQDVEAALRHGEAWQVAQLELERAEAARRAAKAARLAANYSTFDVCLFSDALMAEDDSEPASARQIMELRQAGVSVTPSRKTAERIVAKIKERRKKDLCTYKQARLLSRHGLRHDLKFHEARTVIDAIAQNGWRVPRAVRERFGSDTSTGQGP